MIAASARASARVCGAASHANAHPLERGARLGGNGARVAVDLVRVGVDARRAQHLVIQIAERLGGRDDDRIAGMDAQRVKIFHIANRDAIAVLVAHDFVFYFFKMMQIFFY